MFSLLAKFFNYPFCSSRNHINKPANLNWDRRYYDGQICPGDYYLTIIFSNEIRKK